MAIGHLSDSSNLMRGYVYEREYMVGFPSGSFGFNSCRVKTTTTDVAYSQAGSL